MLCSSYEISKCNVTSEIGDDFQFLAPLFSLWRRFLYRNFQNKENYGNKSNVLSTAFTHSFLVLKKKQNKKVTNNEKRHQMPLIVF